jgi:hypothetical protein
MLLRFRFILWQIVVPFNSQPEKIDPLPAPTVAVTDSQVEQCQWIFDQAGERRVHLEQKAQSTFGLMVFLVPLLASLFVFISSRAPTSGTLSRMIAVSLLVISAVRAVSVKATETLFLQSVVDDAGQFRKYDESFHARGLLYCAAMNEAMNDHLAQFVKGAHILTAAAVVALVVAAVPTSFVLSGLPSSPTQTKIVGPVNVSSSELIAVRDDVASLKEDIKSLLSKGKTADDDLKLLDAKVARLDARLSKMQRTMPANRSKK